MTRYLEPAKGSAISFRGLYPSNFLAAQPAQRLRAWHLVGGLDPLEPADLTGQEPDDGFPVTLADWIQHDGLKCLKVKLRGNDAAVGLRPLGQGWPTRDCRRGRVVDGRL